MCAACPNAPAAGVQWHAMPDMVAAVLVVRAAFPSRGHGADIRGLHEGAEAAGRALELSAGGGPCPRRAAGGEPHQGGGGGPAAMCHNIACTSVVERLAGLCILL